MWQVQITQAMRRCIWPEASLNPVERAVPHIKATAASRELSPHPDFNTHGLFFIMLGIIGFIYHNASVSFIIAFHNSWNHWFYLS